MLFKSLFNSSKQNAAAQPEQTQNGSRILVADADPSVCAMLKESFDREGYTVDQVASPDEAFNLELSSYDLMLMDLTEDENHGMDIIEQIKQLYESNELAVIAYSTKMQPETIIRVLNVGADDYLIKPFPMRELKARVRSVLRRH